MTNQKRAIDSKYISDNSSFLSNKKIKDINSRQDFLNNSLSKGNQSMNKSSKYFYPKFGDRFASKRNSRIYNESDLNDSINNNAYYNKNRNYSYKSPSINKRNNNFSRAANKSYTFKRNYSNHSNNLYNTYDKNNNNYFNQVILLKDTIINQQKKKINDLNRKLLEKNKLNYLQNNESYNESSEDYQISNYNKINNQARMINILNKQNHRLKDENSR